LALIFSANSSCCLQQQALGRVSVAQQLAVGEGFDGFEQQAGMRPGAVGAVKHLVAKAWCIVPHERIEKNGSNGTGLR
jgi:hypothetical protein